MQISVSKIRHSVASSIKKNMPNLYDDIFYYAMYRNYRKRKNTDPNEYAMEIKSDYEKVTGKTLDIHSPRTYSEKIQYLKLYDDNPMRTQLTDKVLVRDWIKETIGEKYLIPIIGVYECFNDIDFDLLPNQFVLKTNHGSGWNVIVKDKKNLNIKHVKKMFDRWMKLDYAFWTEYEIHYSPIKPKIIIEKFVNDSNGQLNDFKFLCFDGDCKFFWMDFDRNTNHKRNVYDIEWNLQPWNQWTYGNYEGTVEKTENFEEMLDVVKTLCKGFRHVRVDLYNVDGKVYFGEMTFTNGSGFEGIYPIEYDRMLGDMIPINNDK